MLLSSASFASCLTDHHPPLPLSPLPLFILFLFSVPFPLFHCIFIFCYLFGFCFLPSSIFYTSVFPAPPFHLPPPCPCSLSPPSPFLSSFLILFLLFRYLLSILFFNLHFRVVTSSRQTSVTYGIFVSLPWMWQWKFIVSLKMSRV